LSKTYRKANSREQINDVPPAPLFLIFPASGIDNLTLLQAIDLDEKNAPV